ncbi:MAG: TAXI family TRAP transporter solute-binding subunit [Rhodospirillales bacterium]|nr:TAXI family TRAP transporter solute-binding subunit [Rhodospirillales bacterium]
MRRLNKTSPERVRGLDDLRAVFSLHAEPFHLVVGKDSNIKSFGDLRGKRVNIGSVGSGHREIMEALMPRYGISINDFERATELPPGRQVAALCDGKIDAFVYAVGIPATGIARATDSCGARLVPVQGAPARQIVADVPGYANVVIPESTYATTATDVPTIGVVATLVTSADTSEETVYVLARTIMEHVNELRGFHPALATLKPEMMISNGIAIPLHPGAEKYYRERGWLVADSNKQ